ncbi:MAG: hypothetical protein KAW92_10540 [Candidatus Cloacimonetes bacterium]|nr:hypothetical protein [Candidatus Cloacimonadota bacterium]
MKLEKIQTIISREVITVINTSGQFFSQYGNSMGVIIPKGTKGIIVKIGGSQYLQVRFKSKSIIKANSDFLQKVKTKHFGFLEEYAGPLQKSMKESWEKIVKAKDTILLTHVPAKSLQMFCV